MIQIKIKRDSIKLNPNFGQTSTKVPTNHITRFTIVGDIPQSIKNDENFVIEYAQHNYYLYGYIEIVTQGYIKNPNEIGHNYPHNVSISIEQKFVTVFHPPIPKYSFEYDMDVKLKCTNCGTEHLIKDIEENSWDKYEVLDVTYCPNCDEYDTFDTWEFENIDKVLKEIDYE